MKNYHPDYQPAIPQPLRVSDLLNADLDAPIRQAYQRMADRAEYLPEPDADSYVRAWTREEDAQTFSIGCTDWRDREALVYIIEAARLLRAVDHDRARTLLRLALATLPSES